MSNPLFDTLHALGAAVPDALKPQQLLEMVQPPQWLIDEVQQCIVLLLNHVLQQEPEAMQRLKRQKGKMVALDWQPFNMHLRATPAGLLDVVTQEEVEGVSGSADLTITITESSPFTLLQAVARNDKPATRIEGDVQLAAEVNWLIDHVRWDMEEDLSRVVGDAAAHRIASVGKQVVAQLKQWVEKMVPRKSSDSDTTNNANSTGT